MASAREAALRAALTAARDWIDEELARDASLYRQIDAALELSTEQEETP